MATPRWDRNPEGTPRARIVPRHFWWAALMHEMVPEGRSHHPSNGDDDEGMKTRR
jgi:hypothetical protein